MEKQKKENGGKETHCICYRGTDHFFFGSNGSWAVPTCPCRKQGVVKRRRNGEGTQTVLIYSRGEKLSSFCIWDEFDIRIWRVALWRNVIYLNTPNIKN